MTASRWDMPSDRRPVAGAALMLVSALALAACVSAKPQQIASAPVPAAPQLTAYSQMLRDGGVSVAIPQRGKFILVNIPSYELIAFQDGNPVIRSKVVVGAAATRTPELMSNMYAIKFNPDWTPTSSMIRNEASVYIPAGPRSPLGRIKLELDNDEAIYLHDTNQRSYFKREKRALSHGCIRVEQVHALAAWAYGVSEEEIGDMIAHGRTYTVSLPEEIPVYLGYYTRFPDEFGQLASHPDIYANWEVEQAAYLAHATARRRAASKPSAQPAIEALVQPTVPGETAVPPVTAPGEAGMPAVGTPAQPAAPAAEPAPAMPAPAAPIAAPAMTVPAPIASAIVPPPATISAAPAAPTPAAASSGGTPALPALAIN